jgi:hypothetical protein
MKQSIHDVSRFLTIVFCAFLVAASSSAAPRKEKGVETAPLTPEGQKLQAEYASKLSSLQADIKKALPSIPEQTKASYVKAREELKKATETMQQAQQPANDIRSAQGLVEHAKGKWIKGAEKGIAQAQAALKKATTDAEREAAKKDLEKWEKNKQDGLNALKERQAALDKAKAAAANGAQAQKTAQASLEQAKSQEAAATKALLDSAAPLLASDKLDDKLVQCAVLVHATPRGLAEYAQQGKEQSARVEKLVGDTKLMKEMLVAGGAKFGKYGQAMEILEAIQKASPKTQQGTLQRLALATSLEFAKPISQSRAGVETNAPAFVDPVKRYLHYEKAFLAGELDPAFKDLTTWEYRMVLDCDAPEHILAWGREMLRNYRPDHISHADYGWRYSVAVRTDVPYGSQNVKDDLPTLHNYQNIIRNGGVCGRRAFFGRFILRAFGIPVWGVTQRAHAALSHWTPKGWVVNLGAGYNASWWDKDEVPLSGSDFLLETQAREHGAEYLKVLRAQWVSKALGEQAYNGRRNVEGGFWSSLAQQQMAVLASSAVALGPLGQELGEANEAPEALEKTTEKITATEADKKVVIAPNGVITIPAAVCSGGQLMKSYVGGQQLFSGKGTITCTVDVPAAGTYALSARVVTVQVSPAIQLSVNDSTTAVDMAIPYTIGKWEQTAPVKVTLVAGKNTLRFTRPAGSRGVSIKDFTLTPVK